MIYIEQHPRTGERYIADDDRKIVIAFSLMDMPGANLAEFVDAWVANQTSERIGEAKADYVWFFRELANS